MNRIERPLHFDDHAALAALVENRRTASYPELRDHADAMREGYRRYVDAAGDVSRIAGVPLPATIGAHLRRHYADPPSDMAHIDHMRRQGGVATCPMCGSMHAGTLDHVMPQAPYPCFAVFGANLVPACKCNSTRSNDLTGPAPGARILHPYFDDVLAERVVAARFDDLGEVPRISLRVMLDARHPMHRAVTFHVDSVVARTQILDHMAREWSKLVVRPESVIRFLRIVPACLNGLRDTLEEEREIVDWASGSRNGWGSMFLTGLLDAHVLDWLFQALTAPGRGAGGSLVGVPR